MTTRSMLLVVAFAATFSSVAKATPYASGVSEAGGTVSFILNEAADSVIIKRTGVADLDLGALAKGAQSFPLDGATVYEIEVSKSAAAGWTQISDDAQAESQFFSPRGVAVNRNPASEFFGRIYVSEAIGGALPNRTLSTFEGLYSLGADQSDILGKGDDAAFGGIDWTTSDNSPFKLTVAPDDTVYIADWSDTNAGVWRAPADLDESSNWPNVLANDNPAGGGLHDNHGSISAVWVEDTGASTKLYTMDEDWPVPNGIDGEGRGDIFRYDIGTATNYTANPVVQVDDNTPAPAGVILNGQMDLVRDEDGTWWVAQHRFTDTAAVPSLTHWADGGTEPLYVSGRLDGLADADFDDDNLIDGADFLTWQRGYPITDVTAQPGDGDANFDGNVTEADLAIWEDQFGGTLDTLNLDLTFGSVDIHNDLDLLIMGGRTSGGVYILDISDPDNPALIDTIPQGGTTNDVAFDIAGNAYVASRSSETLRIWSPGGDWVATTKSDGTFTLAQPPLVTAVPEPTSGLLICLGALLLASRRSRRAAA